MTGEEDITTAMDEKMEEEPPQVRVFRFLDCFKDNKAVTYCSCVDDALTLARAPLGSLLSFSIAMVR